MFIILTGSSGVGKNTVITEIEKSEVNFKLMPTFTTREKRPTEIDGYPFYFISKQEFQEKIKQGELIEHEFIHGNYYGSSYKILKDNLNDNVVLIKDLGIEGAQNLTLKISHLTPVKKIFLTTTKKELKRRLKSRGEKQIKLRLKRYDREQGEINKFDYIIVNNNLEKTCNIIKSIYDKQLIDILPTMPIEKISFKKINKFVRQLKCGKVLKAIDVAIENDKIYIINGHEKFVAGILTNCLVAKKFCDKRVKLLNNEQYTKWRNLIRESSENENL